MNICMIYWFYPPVIGGTGVYLESLSKYLAKKGIRIELLTGPVKGAKKLQRFGKLTVRRIHCMGINGKDDSHKKGHELLEYLQNFIEEKNIALVSAQNFHIGVYPAHTLSVNSACMIKGIPLVNTLHNYCENRLDRIMLQNLMWSKVIAITKNMAEHAYDSKIPIDRISCIYNGVSVKKFSPGKKENWLRNRYNIRERDVVIVCPTKLISLDRGEPLFERKGLITLLKAASVVHQTRKNIKIVITGAPPNPSFIREYRDAAKRLKDMARLYGIGNKLIIMEGVKSKDMPAVYNSSDLMVLASKNEPFGLAYIEAMACELPVIGISGGGVPEIIQNEKNGYITPSDDHVELAKRITWIIRDRKKMERFGKDGRKLVLRKFSLRRMAEETLKVYESLAG